MSPPSITVPAADPGAAYRAHKADIDAAVARVLESGWYVLGAEGRAFETEFAQWLGVARSVGCASGTDALALALRALDIGPGCAVATVSHTAVATVAAIEMVGAEAVLIDVDPLHYTMDPVDLAETLARPPAGLPPIRAVIPVHLYGQPADLDPILSLARRYNASVVEDCSQAHGARFGGVMVGSFGKIAAFSLYPTKNLGALGDGGIVATGHGGLADRLGALRQYGWRSHYISDEVGVNSRLDEVQAAILRVKLAHLDAATHRRQTIAAAYDAALADRAIRPPARRDGATHVFHQYVIRTPDRAALQARLRTLGIATGIHYPVPVHLQLAYRNRLALGAARCRVTERTAEEVLSLPVFPELSDAQVEHVCEALRSL
jgi:dTDP-4-amino-4,6-dideoxygalactose transaminase